MKWAVLALILLVPGAAFVLQVEWPRFWDQMMAIFSGAVLGVIVLVFVGIKTRNVDQITDWLINAFMGLAATFALTPVTLLLGAEIIGGRFSEHFFERDQVTVAVGFVWMLFGANVREILAWIAKKFSSKLGDK